VRVPRVSPRYVDAAPPYIDGERRSRSDVIGAAPVAAAILLIVALCAAISVDVVKTGYGVKGDEATYVMMALSAAYDGDLAYTRRDLDRYVGMYRYGPDGVFLKRGKRLQVRVNATPPFLHVRKMVDDRADRLYFGKATVYSLVAAPLVRVLGLNGFLVLNVLLLFGAIACGYVFLNVRSRPGPAMAFTAAFVFATCLPVYVVFLMPDLFNVALIFYALFFWLYKDVSPSRHGGWIRGLASDVIAATLIAVATYSKVNHALFIAPIVGTLWWRRRFRDGAVVGAAFVMVVAAWFGLNAITTGEFNYQGGDRKYFVGHFPFDGTAEGSWDRNGTVMVTNDADTANVLAPSEFPARFAHNVEYFLVGRHFGLVPYYFPAVVCLVLWLASRDRWEVWRVLTFLTVVGSILFWLVFFPYTWSGGGGPPGNRYFMSQYPALFFLVPQVTTMTPAIVAWIGGALVTAKMVVNPFVTAKFPYDPPERGFARRFPVELTMANDLPIMLDMPRAHIWFSDVMLYFLDHHAYPPEIVDPATGRKGIWVAADGRADILLRCEWPIGHLTITGESRVATTFTASMGSSQSSVRIEPGKPVTFDVPASGVRGLNSYAYMLSVRSSDGFTPRLLDGSDDFRNLGVLMTFKAVPATQTK
jgi:hypothetical protein